MRERAAAETAVTSTSGKGWLQNASNPKPEYRADNFQYSRATIASADRYDSHHWTIQFSEEDTTQKHSCQRSSSLVHGSDDSVKDSRGLGTG
jgi:hypothetical protein